MALFAVYQAYEMQKFFGRKVKSMSHQSFEYIVSACIVVLVMTMAFTATRSMVISGVTTGVAVVILGFMGFVPIWAVAVFVLMMCAYIIYFIGTSGQPIEATEPMNTYWQEYGKRLKSAYASKFGGENTGFDEEVNARISIMENNGRGFTRALAKDWLKRMGRFTEAK